jgi:hypothetical protein
MEEMRLCPILNKPCIAAERMLWRENQCAIGEGIVLRKILHKLRNMP